LPLYDYDCAACGRRFEVIHGVHADPPAACPLCGGGPVRKAITAASVHYKGSGWAKKERRAAVKSAASRGGDEGSSEAGSSQGESGAAGSDAGSSSPDDASRPSVPAPAATGESATGTSRATKSGTPTKPPTRRSD